MAAIDCYNSEGIKGCSECYGGAERAVLATVCQCAVVGGEDNSSSI